MGEIIINAVDGGAGLNAPNTYGTTLFIGNGYEISGGVQGGILYPLSKIQDAEALGITKANDIDNGMSVWKHLSSFFRFSKGQKCYVFIIPDTTVTLGELLHVSAGIAPYALAATSGKALLVAAFRNNGGATDTLLNGFDTEVWSAVQRAQQLAEAQQAMNRPIEIMVEGRHFDGTSSAMTDFRGNAAQFVSVFAGQDMDWASQHSNFQYYAEVGALAGLKAGYKTNHNVGATADGNLQDTANGYWINPGLSNNQSINTLDPTPVSGDYANFYTKGIVVPRTYTDQPGVYLDNDPTCDALTSWGYRMGNVHTYVKAHRLVYGGLFPLINSEIDINPSNGNIAPEGCAIFESAGDDALAPMLTASEISGKKVTCDPTQDVQGTGTVTVNFQVVEKGNASTIVGNISMQRTIQ